MPPGGLASQDGPSGDNDGQDGLDAGDTSQGASTTAQGLTVQCISLSDALKGNLTSHAASTELWNEKKNEFTTENTRPIFAERQAYPSCKIQLLFPEIHATFVYIPFETATGFGYLFVVRETTIGRPAWIFN
jgi:hypothetical protein